MTTATATPAVVPNPGLHLTGYTVTLSKPGETYTYTVKTLCDECRAKTPGTSSMGEVINGFCDGCGAGPSVPHYRLVEATPPPAVTTRITFNRNSFDFDCYATVEGEEMYIGSRPNFFDGETLCRQYRYDAAVDSYCPEQAAAVAMEEFPCDCGVSEPSYASERAASTAARCPCGHPATITVRSQGIIYLLCNPCFERDFQLSNRTDWYVLARAPRLVTYPCEICRIPKPLSGFVQLRADDTHAICDDCRRQAAVRHSGAIADQGSDDTSLAIYELALTDPAALREFLAGHSLYQREQLAWRFASYLRREHRIERAPQYIARNWDNLIGSEEPQAAA